MFTIEVYNTTSRKYKTVRKPLRTRGAAFLALSLVKGRARAKNADGAVIATRVENDRGLGKLSLALDKVSSASLENFVDTGRHLAVGA